MLIPKTDPYPSFRRRAGCSERIAAGMSAAPSRHRLASRSVRPLATLAGLLLPALAHAASEPVIRHALDLKLDPERGTLEVRDRIVLPEPLVDAPGGLTFFLNASPSVRVEEPGARLLRLNPAEHTDIARYRLTLAPAQHQVTLRYAGTLRHDHDFTAAHVTAEGVYLDGAGGWYARFPGTRLEMTLEVELPPGWSAVSQGRGEIIADGAHSSRFRWVETQPQDDLYVVAGRWHRFSREGEFTRAEVYLRTQDPSLAERYLAATERYVALYSRLLGPYPYAKFALVENFWETGLGMPSFTLLGPRVIRLPFILDTAYPHEIVHNWWGNGVSVDIERGNWSEGLTAYLADHLMRELAGEGARYRRDALQKYRNYVDEDEDFALRHFTAKHGHASGAVGYNKALMFFHMLRRRLGDCTFVDGLRRFYREHRFERASYEDLRRALESVSGQDLESEFSQWVDRVGAPRLDLDGVAAVAAADGFHIRGRLRQTQAGPAYRLRVPVTAQLADGGLWRADLEMSGKVTAIDLAVPGRPLKVTVDPEFDLFRELALEEIPPTLGELLGRDGGVAILPADSGLREAYRLLAIRLGVDRFELDRGLESLPSGRPVWVLGWENRFRGKVASTLEREGVQLADRTARVAGEPHARAEHCTVLASRATGTGLAWIGCESETALEGLARKLPHYGKYSYLTFGVEDTVNRLKGSWTRIDSPLEVQLGPELAFSPPGETPPATLTRCRP